MFKQGFTQKQVVQLEQKMLNTARKNLQNELKDHLLKQLVSREGTIELLKNSRNVQTFIATKMMGNSKLGGYNFGNFKGGVQGAVDDALGDVAKDFNLFLSDEMTRTVVGQSMGNISADEAVKRLEDLKEFAIKTGFNYGKWSQELATEKIHMGLVVMDWEKALEEEKNGGQNHKEPEPEPEKSEQDELQEELTGLLIRLNMNRGVRQLISGELELRRLKKRIKAAGLDVDKMMAQAELEAQAISKLKYLDVIKELLAQQATLVVLEGTTYKNIQSQLKRLS